LSIDPDTGVIDIVNSTPNVYTVTYTTSGTCPNSSDQEITIILQDDATFSYTNRVTIPIQHQQLLEPLEEVLVLLQD